MSDIDVAIEDLTTIVDLARAEQSYLGLFPAMYRAVTVNVRSGIRRGMFDDGERLERLVVSFAGLYIQAAEAWRAGRQPPRSWAIAFELAEGKRRLTVLQHLLLGMNAHINLDLGVATAKLADQSTLTDVYRDFVTVNEVLFALIDDLQGCLNDVSPMMRTVDRLGWRLDEAFMRLGLRMCRDQAWRLAEKLVTAREKDRQAVIDERDVDVRALGHLVTHRLSPVNMINLIIRLRESKDVVALIDSFADAEVDLNRVLDRAADELKRAPAEEILLRDVHDHRLRVGSKGRPIFGSAWRRAV